MIKVYITWNTYISPWYKVVQTTLAGAIWSTSFALCYTFIIRCAWSTTCIIRQIPVKSEIERATLCDDTMIKVTIMSMHIYTLLVSIYMRSHNEGMCLIQVLQVLFPLYTLMVFYVNRVITHFAHYTILLYCTFHFISSIIYNITTTDLFPINISYNNWFN
jgi:hypothetical protein